ncbi:MAG: DUF3460 family protein [Rhodocyclaceae bacterium]|nr:DUF3460 family protein [Rhodocyclaceae bacterium]
MAQYYESEHTLFMREWLAAHPQETREQQQGRALWWDKPQDLETDRRNQESRIKQEAYFGNGM